MKNVFGEKEQQRTAECLKLTNHFEINNKQIRFSECNTHRVYLKK